MTTDPSVSTHMFWMGNTYISFACGYLVGDIVSNASGTSDEWWTMSEE